MLELWLAFVAGTVSSLHCVGMCGPIVMGCVVPRPVEISLAGTGITSVGRTSVRSSNVFPHLLYNSGRVISYSLVGMIAGLIGSAAIFSTRLQSGFSICLGLLMIGMAFFQMNVYPKFFHRNRKESLAQRIISSITNSRAPEAKFLIGFMTPFLPCGLLYGMAAQAAASSSPITGAAVMGAFAFGSAPALLLAGLFSGMLGAKIRKMGTTFAAILLIVMGLLTVGRGAGFYHGVLLFPHENHLCGTVH
jgi:sulfite exporter TauE/SafE